MAPRTARSARVVRLSTGQGLLLRRLRLRWQCWPAGPARWLASPRAGGGAPGGRAGARRAGDVGPSGGGGGPPGALVQDGVAAAGQGDRVAGVERGADGGRGGEAARAAGGSGREVDGGDAGHGVGGGPSIAEGRGSSGLGGGAAVAGAAAEGVLGGGRVQDLAELGVPVARGLPGRLAAGVDLLAPGPERGQLLHETPGIRPA